ncbi:MAG: hypothetical protein AABX38_00555 [Candidatus Micrarchaeota archaeon]
MKAINFRNGKGVTPAKNQCSASLIKEIPCLAEPPMERIKTKKRYTNWHSLNETELLSFAQDFISQNSICSKARLKKGYHGLYRELRERRLLSKIKFKEGRKTKQNWKEMNDIEILVYAQNFIYENQLTKATEIRDIYLALYNQLLERGFISKLTFVKRRNWSALDESQIVRFAQKIVDTRKIICIKALQKRYPDIYFALWRRNLLEEVNFELPKRPQQWKSKSNEEILDLGQRLIVENKIKTTCELMEHDSKLHRVLYRRELIQKLQFYN